MLDLNCNLPLGYARDSMINARDSALYDRFLQGKIDVSSVPPSDWSDILRENVMPVAPAGTNQVTLADGSATAANELAISSALENYASAHNRSLDTLSVLGFEYGSHGQSIATLSCSDSAVNANSVPTLDWPIAPLPKLKLPYAANEAANRDEEQRCLDAVKEIIQQRRADSKDVGAMIIEPVSSYGNHAAAPSFYKSLRRLASEEGIPFIVNETKTGTGQTGKMWGHEHWYLRDRDGGVPDIVTFGGKAGISGYYSTLDFRQVSPHAVDMVKLLNFGVTWREI